MKTFLINYWIEIAAGIVLLCTDNWPIALLLVLSIMHISHVKRVVILQIAAADVHAYARFTAIKRKLQISDEEMVAAKTAALINIPRDKLDALQPYL